ncbi:AT-rich interactive domain-containing protein 5B isoform X2 [Gouania willdenowi]|uniref:AT-rich interactive domain-containing protein 5B isoform X2 n=1 Tax=Gouania willdenowi TaxID=441366 RepID=UPI001055B4B1|nr:AT-rich interactive domain-containing protein 5B-like isoform X2 [Gouania willdenowi]
MEHNAIQWCGAPSCQRGSYAFYKSVSGRCRPDGPLQVWRLGEFYFIRCGPQEPVCIAEVTLLWEDQTQRHLLASARLYFLPEDTPKGRTTEHGEDEVVAVSRKMVVRVEDLVRWSCEEPFGWSGSTCSVLKEAPSCTNGFCTQSEGDDIVQSEERSETLKDEAENDLQQHQDVKVLSYPQYCRFRSLQRRLQEGARGPALVDPHLLALGGVKVLPSTRLMYCRDTFSHPTLESSASFTWQFKCSSVSLRGRPRKRRGRDCRDSPTSGHSESWIERMKENVMGSVEAGCDEGWLPHPEEQLFLDQLFAFMERHGCPIHKVPNLGFKKIDLFLLYSVVKRLGGYHRVTNDRLWKVVYNELGGCPGSTSAATCTRRHYERLVLPYEEHLRAGGGGDVDFKIPDLPLPTKPRGIRGRKPLPRGRKPGPKPKDRRVSPFMGPGAPSVTILSPDGSVMVKRGRGRPPGTRNKATLMAEAKLLTQQQSKAKALVSMGVDPQLQNTLLLAKGRGGPMSGPHRPIQPSLLTLPLTPDLSPLSAPYLAFPSKSKDLKSDRGESVTPAPTMLLSTLPRHFVGGSLSGFSPIKGVCPLDVFRSRMSLQRGPESRALTPQDPTQHLPTIYTLQPKSGGPASPHPVGEQSTLQHHPPPPLHQQLQRCCDEGGPRGGCREAKPRPPLPPLRVLPLNLDCSVQVCQLMRTRRLDSSQLQTFTRRLSEALSQDLGSKPPCAPITPITPPPEQALPLNLSKRFPPKRPGSEGPEPSRAAINGDLPSSKRSRPEPPEEGDGWSGATPGEGSADVEVRNQEEPADLSSPSRIRAFLLGLPPFQVKLEEDLNGMRFGKFLAPGPQVGPQQTDGEGGASDTAVKNEEEEEKPETVKVGGATAGAML